MQAPAQHEAEDDMFAGTPYAPPESADPGPCLRFDGTLIRNAEVRNKPAKDGLHSVPVVCVELASTQDGGRKVCHAEFPFTDDTRAQAEALAKTLTRRKKVIVTAPTAHMCITFTHVLSIAIHQEQ